MALKKKPLLPKSPAEKIFRYFLAPLSRFKVPEIDMGMHWDCLFNAGSRHIYVFKAKKTFDLPGLYYLAGNVKVQGVGPRHVKRGEYLFVRVDATDPNHIDVEHSIRNEEHVFALNSSEWGWIKLNLTPVNFKKK